MSELNYTVELQSGERFAGAVEARGEARVVLPLKGTLRSVTASMKVELAAEEKIFINGFQTWTYCPEYTQRDRIRSLRHLPRKGVEHYGLERYGDGYFVDYPNKKGLTHGESWCYFRRGENYRLVASLDEDPGYTLFTAIRSSTSTRTGESCRSAATARGSASTGTSTPSTSFSPRAARRRSSTRGSPRWA